MENQRYTSVAIVLHWLIALSILGLMAAGWWMVETAESLREMAPDQRKLIGPQVQKVFQLHKSMGLTVLVLSLARLAWRLAHKPPPPPAGVPTWQKTVAGLTHAAFYVLMIGLPLSGWIYTSTGYNGEGQPFAVTTLWFGLFEVPKIPFVADAADEVRKAMAENAVEAHELMVYAVVALLVLHIGAALKHQYVDKDGVLSRMIPLLKRSS